MISIHRYRTAEEREWKELLHAVSVTRYGPRTSCQRKGWIFSIPNHRLSKVKHKAIADKYGARVCRRSSTTSFAAPLNSSLSSVRALFTARKKKKKRKKKWHERIRRWHLRFECSPTKRGNIKSRGVGREGGGGDASYADVKTRADGTHSK